MTNVKHGFEIPKTSKRYGHLYEIAFTKENLYEAYLDARRSKRGKRATYKFELDIGSNLDRLYSDLHNGVYTITPYREFIVYEPKRRVIQAPHFRDLIVQHAIYRVIYNIFNPAFIDTSFACRKNGGTHKASQYTQKSLRKYNDDLYSVKLDIKSFFYSIDRSVLEDIFRKKIKDKRFVELMLKFAEAKGSRVGIPIGNLLSQLYSLIYMNELDHFIKRSLKIKNYVRYVDDFVLIGLTLKEAKEAKIVCENFVQNVLKMQLSHWHIKKIKRGLNFVGYKTFKSYKVVRKHSLYKFRKSALKGNVVSLVSIIGHAKNTKSVKYMRSMLERYMPNYKIQLPQRSIRCLNM